MSDHTPPTDEELAEWKRYFVGDDPRNHGSLGRLAPQTRYSIVVRRLIAEVQRLRAAVEGVELDEEAKISRDPIRATPARERTKMSNPNMTDVPNAEEFLAINGDQPDHDEKGARRRWGDALADWGGVISEDELYEMEIDALDYVGDHIGFGKPVVYQNVRAHPTIHGPRWVAYPEAGTGIRATLKALTNPATDDNKIAKMQVKAVKQGHAFEVYSTLVPPRFRLNPEAAA